MGKKHEAFDENAYDEQQQVQDDSARTMVGGVATETVYEDRTQQRYLTLQARFKALLAEIWDSPIQPTFVADGIRDEDADVRDAKQDGISAGVSDPRFEATTWVITRSPAVVEDPSGLTAPPANATGDYQATA